MTSQIPAQNISPASSRLLPAFLFAAALFLYLLGNNAHSLWDRDEARFSEATRLMLESGDWIVPHLNGAIRYDKPVLIYWLMAGPMATLGVCEFAARLPAALAGAFTILTLFLFARRLTGSDRAAFISALTALCFGVLFAISKAATTDSVLTLSIVSALYFYWRNQTESFSWPRHFAFWAALALSTLTKGPIGPAIIALTILAERLTRRHAQDAAFAADMPNLLPRAAAGLLFYLALTLPWGIAATMKTLDAPHGTFLLYAFKRHVVERGLSDSMEGHKGPFLFYIALLPALVFPMTPAVLNAMRWGFGARKNNAVRFLWCWFLPGLLMFSAAKTKLPHYIAPLLPALALMAGCWWRALENALPALRTCGAGTCVVPGKEEIHSIQPGPVWWKTGAVLMAFPGAVLLAGVAAAFLFAQPLMQKYDIPAPLLSSAATLALFAGSFLLIGAWKWWHMLAPCGMRSWAAVMAGFALIGMIALLPALEPLRPSKPLGEWIARNTPPTAHLMAVQYKEPSLMFYARRGLEEIGRNESGKALAQLRDAAKPAVLIIPKDRWDAWLKEQTQPLPPNIRSRHTQRCFNLQKSGGWMELLIITN